MTIGPYDEYKSKIPNRSKRPQRRSKRPNQSQRPHRRTERPDRSRYHETFRCQTVREKFHSYRPNDDLRHSQDSQPMTLLYLPRNPGMMKHRPYFLINNLDGYNSTSTKLIVYPPCSTELRRMRSKLFCVLHRNLIIVYARLDFLLCMV